jgi:hypothetical protein
MEAQAAAARGSKRTGPQGPTGAKTCQLCYERGWDFTHHWKSSGKCQSQCAPCSKKEKKKIEVDAKGCCNMCKSTYNGKVVVESKRRMGNPPKGAS